MSSSENDKPTRRIAPPPTRKEHLIRAAEKLAAADPKDRDLLLRLERARRGLTIARTTPGGHGLADAIAAVPDDQVAAVAMRMGIRTGDRTPQELRTSMLLRHEDQVRAAIAAAARSETPYPPLPEDGLVPGGQHRYGTYSPSPPYGDKPTDPVTAYRLGAQLMLDVAQPDDGEQAKPAQP